MMVWNSASNLASRNHGRRGLGASITSGLVCQEAERLGGSLFRAISVRNGVLKVAASTQNLLAIKLEEGRILAELNQYCQAQGLPHIDRLRLTEETELGKI